MARTVDAVRKYWPQVFEYYGLPPVTGKRHFKGECPLCGKKEHFRCDNENDTGSWICTCGQGDGWSLLRLATGKNFGTLAREIDTLIGNDSSSDIPTKQAPVKSSRARRHAQATQKFQHMQPLNGTHAQDYLRSRGINCLPQEWIRYSDRQRADGGIYQGMIALATDDRASVCYLHRTLLDGGKKAAVSRQKQMFALQEDTYLDHAHSVAIRMFPASSTLGIAEGIETALSCRQIYGVNTWSTMNAGFMAKFIAPHGVRHLIIFTDMDKTSAAGHAAATACAKANLSAKNDVSRVSVRWCDNGDFNDLLVNGAQCYQVVFEKVKNNG